VAPNSPSTNLTDPSQLIKQAMSFFDTDAPAAPGPMPAQVPMPTAASAQVTATVEDAIRNAHELVSPDLYVIERLKQSGLAPDYSSLFSTKSEEKIAAVLFLTKNKLLDIEASAAQSRDIDDARRDLSALVEILFHMRAVEALTVLYDFASKRGDSAVPWLWRNVTRRCLHLLSLLDECRARVVRFLHERPDARETLEELEGTTKEELALMFRSLLMDYQQLRASGQAMAAQGPEPGYLSIYHQYEQAGPSGSASGYSSLLTAQDRIQQAVQQGDTSTLVSWIREGSPAAMKAAFHQAMALMPIDQYITLLRKTLEEGELDPVRMTVAVLELGAVNRSVYPNGGSPLINDILKEVALWESESVVGVARVAVGELGAMKAWPELQYVAENAAQLAVAEEVFNLFSMMRRLQLAQNVLAVRPELEPAYTRVRAYLNELRDLVDSVCACPSEEMAMIYLERLRDRNAIFELEQLVGMQNHVSPLAKKMLAEIQPAKPLGMRKR